ncbi:MAG: DUF4172 domain-containing protein [Fibrobacter sp.]|nr:DUF4172 domain-containing protein [Fibrobacter sp.]
MLFVHQYPDWTNFRYMRSQIIDPLCRVRFLQGLLQGKASFAASKELSESLSKKDLMALMKIDGRSEVPEVFYSAIRNFSLPMSEKRLLALHASIVPNGGHFRKGVDPYHSKILRGFEGVSAERIPREVTKFIEAFNDSKTDAVLKAAIIHFHFATIRPFDSGNGAMARLFSKMLLAKSEETARCFYTFDETILENKDAYFEALYKAQTSNGEITSWILWFLHTLETALSKASENLTRQFEITKQQLSISGVPLTEREQKLVEHLRENPEISSSEWASLANISHDSALRDLNGLVQKKVLKKSNSRGRSTRYSI